MVPEPIGKLAMFQHRTPRGVVLRSGEPVLVYNTGTDLVAVGDVCPHKKAALSEGDIEDLGSALGACILCPRHRRKFNGGGLYFSLRDGSSHVRGDAGSCKKYKPRWSVPVFDVTVDPGSDEVFISRREDGEARNPQSSDAAVVGAGTAVEAPTSSSWWQRWAISRVERTSKDSSVYNFRREPGVPPKEPPPPAPESWHVTMRLRYTRRRGGKKRRVEREYTPISSLAELCTGTMAILIKIYPDGKLTQRLSRMRVGDSVEFSPPEPTLRLVPHISLPSAAPTPARGEGPLSIGMVAGGTGIAPVWQLLCAMQRYPDAFGGRGCSARLVYSNHRRADILLLDELDALAQQWEHPHSLGCSLDFRVLHTLTASGAAPAGWTAATGHISVPMLLSMLPPPSPRTVVVICGPPGMNDTAMRLLHRAGYSRSMLIELEA